VIELLQVKRERGGRHIELFSDPSGCLTFGSGLNQKAKDQKTRFLSERRKRAHGFFSFHNSMIMEI
jgi:hypothetical protein